MENLRRAVHPNKVGLHPLLPKPGARLRLHSDSDMRAQGRGSLVAGVGVGQSV